MGTPLSSDYVAALSRSAMAFARMSPGDDLYREIALQFEALLGEAIVTVCSFDASTGHIEQRALVGVPVVLGEFAKRMQARGSVKSTTANPEAVEQMTGGRLIRIEEGLYELCLRKVPRAMTRSFEKLAGIHSVYGMGCVADGECFGGVSFCLRGKAVLPPEDVMEAIVFQAATAIRRWRAESELRKSEERYRLLMEKAADPYAVADLDARFLEVNDAALVALGYTRDEFLALTAPEVLDTDDLLDRPFPWEQIRNREDFTQTRRVRRKDGTYVTFEVHTVPLPDEQVLFCARDVTERRKLERAVIEACEEGRRTIGRDLHDSLGQQIAAIGYMSTALENSLRAENSPAADRAGQIAELVRDAVGQTRRIARGLCPVDMSQEGFTVSLERLASQLNAAGEVECTLDINGSVESIPGETTSHLYQITQEAANNAIRHGHADRIAITLNIRDGHGDLSIRDNGSGIPIKAENGVGLGLRAMRYRAELIDGVLDVQSSDTGSVITCSFSHPHS